MTHIFHSYNIYLTMCVPFSTHFAFVIFINILVTKIKELIWWVDEVLSFRLTEIKENIDWNHFFV